MVGQILLGVSSYTARIDPEEGPPSQVDTYCAAFAASDASLHSLRHQMYPRKFGASTSLRDVDVGAMSRKMVLDAFSLGSLRFGGQSLHLLSCALEKSWAVRYTPNESTGSCRMLLNAPCPGASSVL
jgi:hypothetical protein